MEWLIRVLIALFLALVAPAGDPQMSSGSPTVRSPMLIESVEIVVLESFPMQVHLVVKGQHPDGCDLPVIIEQGRSENTVTVEIYRELPIDLMCAMMVVPYEATIPLDGTFEPGSYTFQVNDYVVQQQL